MTLFVLEGTEKRHQIKLFSILGVDYAVTMWAVLNPLLMSVMGIAAAMITKPVADTMPQIVVGFGYGILIMLASFLHGLGHIISSRMANAPMETLVATMTVNITRYPEDEGDLPARVHIGRAIGGPILNLAVGLTMLVLGENHATQFFGGINLLFFVITISPIPSVDGWTILRALRE